MKRTNRVLSLLLAVLMLVTMAPLTVLPQRANAGGGTNSQNWDYNDTTTLYEAMQAAENYRSSDLTKDPNTGNFSNLLPEDPGGYEWVQVSKWSELRDALKSTDASKRYICLTDDISETTSDDTTENDEIIIYTDKVVDLNGHAIKVTNKKNKERNSENACGATVEKNGESTKTVGYRYTLFEIDQGTTVFMDTSKDQSGYIYNYAHNVNPFDHEITKWVSRDIFSVTNGNLVIFGGSYYAGREKLHFESSDIWGTIKTFCGKAITLATKITKYGTGISEAEAGLKDVEANIEQAKKLAEEKAKQNNTPGADDGNVSLKNEPDDSTKTDESKINKKDTPTGDGTGVTGSKDSQTRDKTIGERQDDKDKNDHSKPDNNDANTPEAQEKAKENNKSNDKGSAKEDEKKKQQGQQQQQEPPKITDAQDVAKAKTAIAEAAIGETGGAQLMDIISDGLDLVDYVVTECSRAKKCCTQYTLGTVVKVLNKGTFVAYGGKFYGHGSTEEQKEAVIEVVQAPKNTNEYGRAYIYGGEFYGRGGANIFNIIRKNTSQASKYFVKNPDTGGYEVRRRSLPFEETGNYEVLYLNDDNETFVDTSQIQVRGGKFRTMCDTLTTGLTIDGAKPTILPGFPGSVNLGVESYNEEFIRDGRIQIIDSFGDGSLVLLDELKDKNNGEPYHYRLFCSDAQLRTLDNIDVLPNEMEDRNVNNSFQLVTDFNNYDVSSVWAEDEENVRAPIARMDRYFDYPIDGKYHENYGVTVNFDDDDVYGADANHCECWYYPTPEKVQDALENLLSFEKVALYWKNGCNTFCRSQKNDKDWDDKPYYWDTGLKKYREHAGYAWQSSNYFRNVKYFTYKIYRVDPLTMENISVKDHIPGKDEPVKTLRYATSNGTLRTKIELHELGIEYQRGEMYRITLQVDEQVQFSGGGLSSRDTTKTLKTKCTSSIVFRCVGHDELKEGIDSYGHPKLTADYTPIQLGNDLRTGDTVPAGSDLTATFQARTGQIDRQARKIFDLYYQWYVKNPNGEDILIAGTDHIVDNPADIPDHMIEKWLPGVDGYQYKNTKPLPTKEDGGFVRPDGWTCEDIHTYIHMDYASEHGVWLTPPKDGGKKTYSNNDIYGAKNDTLYIPESLAGETIYCKVIAINNWWPINYDRRQTFYSHEIKVEGARLKVQYEGTRKYAETTSPAIISFESMPKLASGEKVTEVTFTSGSLSKAFTGLSVTDLENMPKLSFPTDFGSYSSLVTGFNAVVATVKTNKGNTFTTSEYFGVGFQRPAYTPHAVVEYAKGNNTATAAAPATVRVDDLVDLEDDEWITELTYWDGTAGKTFTGLHATTVEELPTARYPTDWSTRTKTGVRGMRCWAKSNKGNEYEQSMPTFTYFNYDVSATSFTCTVPAAWHNVATRASDGVLTYVMNDEARAAAGDFRINVQPSYASIDKELIPGSNLLTSNEAIASFDEDGNLILGDAVGDALITIVSPNGTEQKFRIVNPVDEIDITIKAPELNEPISFYAGVPEGAPYKVDEFKWIYTAEKYDMEMAPGDKVRPFIQYKAYLHIVSNSASGYSVVNSATSVRLHILNPDGTEDVEFFDRSGDSVYGDYQVVYHTFSAIEDLNGYITNLVAQIPTTVSPYTSQRDLFDQIEIFGDVKDGIKVEKTILADSDDCASVSSYFLPGARYTLQLTVTALFYKGYRWADDVTLTVSGQKYKAIKGTTSSDVYFRIPITVGYSPEIPHFPKAVETQNIYDATPGGTYDLKDYYHVYGECTYPISYIAYNADYVDIDQDSGILTIHSDAPTDDYFQVSVLADVDINNDGVLEATVKIGDFYVYLKSKPKYNVQITEYDVSGRIVSNRTVTETDNTFYLFFNEIENTFITNIETSDYLMPWYLDPDRNMYMFSPFGAPTEDQWIKVYHEAVPGTPQVSVSIMFEGSDNDYVTINSKSFDTGYMLFSFDGINYSSIWSGMENPGGGQKTLYYKQGKQGKVYTVKVDCPGTPYNIFINDEMMCEGNAVSFKNRGISYDPATNTLTLENCNIRGTGESIHDNATVYYGNTNGLTINVIGDCSITNTDTEEFQTVALRCKGPVTFTGSGTLYVNSGSGRGYQYGIFAPTNLNMDGGSVIVNMNSSVVPSQRDYGILGKIFSTDAYKAEVAVIRGTLEVNCTQNTSNYRLIYGDIIKGDFCDSYTIELGATANSRTPYTGNDVASAVAAAKSLKITATHTHTYNEQVEAKAYVASYATCTNSIIFYYSCACSDYTTEKTFGGEEIYNHVWTKVNGRAPTYDAAGYTDYELCTVCGLVRNGEELPKLERPTAPDAPTGIAAAATAPGEITVSWNAMPRATRYDVYRMDDGEYVKIGSAADPAYVDTGLNAGETYYYKIIAVNESIEGELASGFSDRVSAKATAAPPATHNVTVTGGTADPAAAAKGASVTITANVPDSKEFDRWEVVKGDITLADASKATTTFVMGDADVEVKAVFKDVFHTVTVTSGTTSVNAAAKGTTVTITAAAAPEGKAFDKWEVVKGNITLADATANVTTFVMGDENVEVKAVYRDIGSSGEEGVFGDIDGDGNITAADARLALRMSVDIMHDDGIPFTDKQITAADVDRDGRVTGADARLLLRKAVGLEVLSEGWAGPV